MSIKHLNIRIPLGELGDAYVAAVVGSPEVEVGSLISMRDYTTMASYRDLYVRDVISEKADKVSPSILSALGYTAPSELTEAFRAAFRTPIPADSMVTVLVLADPDVDIEDLYEEAVPVEDELATAFEEEDLEEEAEAIEDWDYDSDYDLGEEEEQEDKED